MGFAFVHPFTKESLIADAQGDLCCSHDQGEILLRQVDGCYDFVVLHESTADRGYYDEHYHHGCGTAGGDISVASIGTVWEQNSSYHLLYETVGDVRGKSMLLLGNGISGKEVRFAAEGANVVYTDISLEAVLTMKRAYEGSTLRTQNSGDIQFHAVDALHLPFQDGTFDVIYGCAFAHHLQDLPTFFREVHRCLKTGGKCVFLDDAHSQAWQFAKATILRPLQMFSHWRSGISPEDKVATQKGGYSKDELEEMLVRHGFKSLIYRRTMFFEHLIRRGSTKVLSRGIGQAFAPIGRCVDRRLLGPRWIERHGMHLVWGFTK